MEFRVLGTLEVWHRRQLLTPLRPRQERLLARLLLSPNKIASIATLAETLWDGEPPDSADRQVQNAASQLRAAWLQAGVTDAKRVIQTVRFGYRLAVRPEELDLFTFRRLVKHATAMEEAGDTTAAVSALRQAVALWRGPAFAGIASAVIESNAALINEERPAAWEECFRLELQAGQGAQVVTELACLVAEFPYRERLIGQLMIALYRSGRQKEALQAYQDIRERLAEELGIDPGPNLQRLYERILRSDPTLSTTTDAEHGPGPAPGPRRVRPGVGAPADAAAGRRAQDESRIKRRVRLRRQ